MEKSYALNRQMGGGARVGLLAIANPDPSFHSLAMAQSQAAAHIMRPPRVACHGNFLLGYCKKNMGGAY